MSTINYKEITNNGLWTNNVGLVQLLGLCPLLAVSNTVINALGLGLATMLTLIVSNVSISIIRNWVRPEVRIPIFVLIIASVVTAIELSMKAYFFELYSILGIFIPLIVTNCAIIGRAEAFAAKNNPLASAVDGFMMGLGFGLVLIVLGAMREILGAGTLFSGAHLLLGEFGHSIVITLISDYRGFLLAVLPPGAFIGLGLLIAGKKWLDNRAASKVPAAPVTPAVEPEQV